MATASAAPALSHGRPAVPSQEIEVAQAPAEVPPAEGAPASEGTDSPDVTVVGTEEEAVSQSTAPEVGVTEAAVGTGVAPSEPQAGAPETDPEHTVVVTVGGTTEPPPPPPPAEAAAPAAETPPPPAEEP